MDTLGSTFQTQQKSSIIIWTLEENWWKLQVIQVINWKQDHQESLDQLLRSLTELPILAYPDYNLQFILHVNASSKGLGAVLFQFQEKQSRIIGYGRWTLTQAEKKNHSLKLEFLAVKRAFYKHFRDYLYYAPSFEIDIDNNPVTYTTTTTGKLIATGQRWVYELAEFNFSFPFRPVKQNVIVDNLSLPSSNNLLQCMEVYTNLIPADQVKAVLDRTESKYNNTWSVCLNIPMVEAQKILDNLTPTMCFTVKYYQKGQQAEYWISRVKNIIKGTDKSMQEERATRCSAAAERPL